MVKKVKSSSDAPVFHLRRLKPHNATKGGKRVKASRENFPSLQGMSLYRLTLYPNGVREPHWHANADELGYCLEGQAVVTFFGSGNMRESFIVKKGQVFLVPSGYIHCIENIGKGNCEFLLEFSHELPEDFSLSSTMGMFSDAVLGNTWDRPSSVFKKLERDTQESFAVLQTNPKKLSQETFYTSAYHYDLEGSLPVLIPEQGNAKVARKNVWPAVRSHVLYSLVISGSGMREPHWHPETAELGYVAQGEARMAVMMGTGEVKTYTLSEGDIYFIPKAYPHHIENLSKTDLHFLIFFDQPMPQDVGFTAGVRAFSDEVLGACMGISSSFFQELPKYYVDQFVVNKKNVVD